MPPAWFGRPRVVGMITGLAIALTATISIAVVYGVIKAALLDDLRNYLRRTAETAAASVDGDRHALIADSSQTGSPEYRALVQPLEALLRANPDIRFAYSGIVRGDSMFYVLDGEPSTQRAYVMEPDVPTAGELEVTRDRRTVVERRPSASAWGIGIRAYAPIYGPSGPTGAYVGVTMNADRYERWLRRVYEASALGLAAACLFAVLGGIVAARGERTKQRAAVAMAKARELSAAAADDRRAMEQLLHRRQKMEALGTLAGGVAHDFNNLLTVMLGHAEMIEADAPAESASGMSAAAIRTAAVRARDVVRRILMFARPETETRTSTSLGPLIDETVQLLAATLPSSIRISWRRPTVPVAAVVNPSQLTQVLMNLGVNASHALPEERGRIEIGLDRVDLGWPDATRLGVTEGAFARVTVRDSGVGMSDEIRARIFEPFFTTKPVGKGSGLGLAVAEGVVRGHRGAIEVESTVGVGTTFTIYLPASEAAARISAPRFPAAAGVDGRVGQRLLLLDDDALVLDAMSQLLRRAGYEVVTYADPGAALAALETNPTGYHALVTDRTMPKLSGLEVAERARALNPALPIILLTGAMHQAEPDLAQVSVTVAKPTDGPTLLAAVERAIAAPVPAER